MEKTGNSEQYKTNNIYDLVGNVSEWTMEAQEIYPEFWNNDFCRVTRGGYYVDEDGYDFPVSMRGFTPFSWKLENGFRIALYIK